MQGLLDAVVDLVALVSPAKVYTIASALRGLPNAGAAPKAHILADTSAARESIARVIAAWGEVSAAGDEVAGMLLGASAAKLRVDRELSVELVWTGPTTRFVPTRRTEQVLLDLISAATTEIFLVSFVAYDVPSVVAALNGAAGRGVRVRILVEASKDEGGTLDTDIVPKLRASVPTATILTWQERTDRFLGGKVHAKLALIDRGRAFITSANLTRHALERNMEAGVLMNGGPLPQTLSDHLLALLDTGVITPAGQS